MRAESARQAEGLARNALRKLASFPEIRLIPAINPTLGPDLLGTERVINLLLWCNPPVNGVPVLSGLILPWS
jgi:hypothetical protein